MKMQFQVGCRPACRAFTLAEVVISMGISVIVIGSIISGYLISAQRAEWSAYSLAAHSLAMQRLEQVRAAKWDPLGWPPTDEAVPANFPLAIEILDIPITGTNIAYATNRITIRDVSVNPPLKMVRVDTVWAFKSRGLYTNTLTTYRAPDQ